MVSSHESKLGQPAPDLHTRPVRTHRRLGRWVWIVIAVAFILFVIVSIVTRATFLR